MKSLKVKLTGEFYIRLNDGEYTEEALKKIAKNAYDEKDRSMVYLSYGGYEVINENQNMKGVKDEFAKKVKKRDFKKHSLQEVRKN